MVFKSSRRPKTALTRLARSVAATLALVTAAFLTGAEAATPTSVATIPALRALPAPTTAAVVAVSSHTVAGDGGGGSFRFDVLSSAADNNGTVVAPSSGARGRWLRVYTGAVSVRWFGARGDGVTYDTVAIQGAVNAAPAGGTVSFPAGTYRVHSDRAVQLKSDLRLDLGTAALVGGNVNGARCRLLEIQGKRNVVISGGTLVGSQLGTPQWGVGILASDAESLVIENVRLQTFFFDGILLTGNRGCRYVTVRGTVAQNNRRAGMSVVAASDVTVTGSTFEGSAGQSPEAGVNVEPNAGTSVARVRFENCAFAKNAGIGLYVHRGLGDSLSDITVVANVVKDNDQGIAIAQVVRATVNDNEVSGHRGRAKSGITVGGTTGVIRIANNDLVDNFRGILAADASVEILKNTIVGTGPLAGPGQGDDGEGIVCRSVSAPHDESCVLGMNTVRRTAGSGIQVLLLSHALVAGNVIDSTGQRGIHLRYSKLGTVRDNTIAGTGLEAPGSYYVLELAQDSDGNVVTRNAIHVGSARGAIGISADSGGNSVYANAIARRGGTEPVRILRANVHGDDDAGPP